MNYKNKFGTENPASDHKMHILIAPNTFKNSLNAREVAAAIEQGFLQSKLNCATTCFPIADGGDGTGGLIIEACKGTVVPKEVRDPLGRKTMASFGLIDNGKTAVIEMADASGLRLLDIEELNPMQASSFGTGELIKFALDEGVTKIILAMGGSATVDGGCGILNALGVHFYNQDDYNLPPTPQSLLNMTGIDTAMMDQRVFDCQIVILCDVDNKLLGPEGSAYVFGPQKGATATQVNSLECFLKNFSEISAAIKGIDMAKVPHGGAAGGAAAGLHIWLNAKLVNGIDYFLDLTNFDQLLQESDLLITGEGSIDRQTLGGKGPYGVASRAKKRNIPVIGIAGKVPVAQDVELNKYFDVLVSINHEPMDILTAMHNTGDNLIRTAASLGNLFAIC